MGNKQNKIENQVEEVALIGNNTSNQKNEKKIEIDKRQLENLEQQLKDIRKQLNMYLFAEKNKDKIYECVGVKFKILVFTENTLKLHIISSKYNDTRFDVDYAIIILYACLSDKNKYKFVSGYRDLARRHEPWHTIYLGTILKTFADLELTVDYVGDELIFRDSRDSTTNRMTNNDLYKN